MSTREQNYADPYARIEWLHERVDALKAERDRLREFVRYVRDGNVGHISDEGIEWADRLLGPGSEGE